MKIVINMWAPKSTIKAEVLEMMTMFSNIEADIEINASLKNEAKTSTKK